MYKDDHGVKWDVVYSPQFIKRLYGKKLILIEVGDKIFLTLSANVKKACVEAKWEKGKILICSRGTENTIHGFKFIAGILRGKQIGKSGFYNISMSDFLKRFPLTRI